MPAKALPTPAQALPTQPQALPTAMQALPTASRQFPGPGGVGLTREPRLRAVGSTGRTNLRWEPTAAGKGGAESAAATRLMRATHKLISSALLVG